MIDEVAQHLETVRAKYQGRRRKGAEDRVETATRRRIEARGRLVHDHQRGFPGAASARAIMSFCFMPPDRLRSGRLPTAPMSSPQLPPAGGDYRRGKAPDRGNCSDQVAHAYSEGRHSLGHVGESFRQQNPVDKGREAADPDRAFGGNHSHQDARQRRFPGAVRSNEAHAAPLGDRERDVVERGDPPEPLGDVASSILTGPPSGSGAMRGAGSTSSVRG